MSNGIDSASGWITLTAAGLGSGSDTVDNGTPGVKPNPQIDINAGKTTTVTLTSSGTLTAKTHNA